MTLVLSFLIICVLLVGAAIGAGVTKLAQGVDEDS